MQQIITYFRSSSYGTYDFCEHKFLMDWTLGYHSPANKSASKGSAVHKALELLAKKKLCMQNGETEFEDEDFGHFKVNEVLPDDVLILSYKHYSTKDKFDWKHADFVDCKRWMHFALDYKNGMFSPLQRDIVEPEKYFDFLIEEPWAVYDYTLPDGNKISGYLGIKGTMDLMTRVGEDYEMIDWKTGARRDWNKGRTKEYEDLMMDPQLLLYYYAARRLYPDIKNIYVTIFYMQAGGPFSLCFGDEHIVILKEMLKKRFNEIQNNFRPKLIYPNKKCEWCFFSKNGVDGPVDNYDESLCKAVHKDVVQLGLEKVMKKYSKDLTYNAYGAGGGKENRGVKHE